LGVATAAAPQGSGSAGANETHAGQRGKRDSGERIENDDLKKGRGSSQQQGRLLSTLTNPTSACRANPVAIEVRFDAESRSCVRPESLRHKSRKRDGSCWELWEVGFVLAMNDRARGQKGSFLTKPRSPSFWTDSPPGNSHSPRRHAVRSSFVALANSVR
jgi:hypothetical protein